MTGEKYLLEAYNPRKDRKRSFRHRRNSWLRNLGEWYGCSSVTFICEWAQKLFCPLETQEERIYFKRNKVISLE